MQQVITAKQAREITKGRKPLVPVVYEEAVKALGECLSLDDAKEWDNKADALAAWAKIYQDGKVERQAKALKLHAYRRMGELALALAKPRVFGNGRKGGCSSPGGARAVLGRAGLQPSAVIAASRLGSAAKQKFDDLMSMPRIPSPMSATRLLSDNEVTPAYRALCQSNMLRSGFRHIGTLDIPSTVAQMTVAERKTVLGWLVPGKAEDIVHG